MLCEIKTVGCLRKPEGEEVKTSTVPMKNCLMNSK